MLHLYSNLLYNSFRNDRHKGHDVRDTDYAMIYEGRAINRFSVANCTRTHENLGPFKTEIESEVV